MNAPIEQTGGYVPADRLRAIIQHRWVDRGRDLRELARRSRVSERSLGSLMRGEREHVLFSTADRIIVVIDVWLWRTAPQAGGLADVYGVDQSAPESYDSRYVIAPAARKRSGARRQGGNP